MYYETDGDFYLVFILRKLSLKYTWLRYIRLLQERLQIIMASGQYRIHRFKKNKLSILTLKKLNRFYQLVCITNKKLLRDDQHIKIKTIATILKTNSQSFSPQAGIKSNIHRLISIGNFISQKQNQAVL